MSHTPEPWAVSTDKHGVYIHDANKDCIVEHQWIGLESIEEEDDPEIFEKIVKAVNNCKGINPEAVPMMVEALDACNCQCDDAPEGILCLRCAALSLALASQETSK